MVIKGDGIWIDANYAERSPGPWLEYVILFLRNGVGGHPMWRGVAACGEGRKFLL